MIKKQRTFWLSDTNWNRLNSKVAEQGLKGKGKLERFMEKICNETIIFIKGNAIIEIREK